MNIQLFKLTNNNQNVHTNFGAKFKPKEVKIPENVCNDILEFSSMSKNPLPEKMEFTPVEQTAKEILKEIHLAIQNLIVQKMNLRHFYSVQDKYDYQELLKRKNGLISKLNRLTKKNGYEESRLERIVMQKKEYNIYAPKIYRAKTLKDLDLLVNQLQEIGLYASNRSLLNELIKKRKNEISSMN